MLFIFHSGFIVVLSFSDCWPAEFTTFLIIDTIYSKLFSLQSLETYFLSRIEVLDLRLFLTCSCSSRSAMLLEFFGVKGHPVDLSHQYAYASNDRWRIFLCSRFIDPGIRGCVGVGVGVGVIGLFLAITFIWTIIYVSCTGGLFAIKIPDG